MQFNDECLFEISIFIFDIYFSVNNVLGFKNVNGYQYANTQNANGNFSRRALTPAADQFFFVGFFWTISEKGTDNQLDNL